MPRKSKYTAEDYQNAWDIIADYMDNQPDLSFSVNPWDKKGRDRYCLTTIHAGMSDYKYHFLAIKARKSK